jgi:hypothetical protein
MGMQDMSVVDGCRSHSTQVCQAQLSKYYTSSSLSRSESSIATGPLPLVDMLRHNVQILFFDGGHMSIEAVSNMSLDGLNTTQRKVRDAFDWFLASVIQGTSEGTGEGTSEGTIANAKAFMTFRFRTSPGRRGTTITMATMQEIIADLVVVFRQRGQLDIDSKR